MLAGLAAFNSSFLGDLNSLEAQLSQTNQQISSGVRVNEASDDPGDLEAILGYQNDIAQTTQVQTDLGFASTRATAADTALSSANALLNQLTSLATQGASSTTSEATRVTLGQQVQGIQQELVGLANTSVQGQYIFGGDEPTIQPYSLSSSGSVVQINMASNTGTTQDAEGQSIVSGLTAQTVFDARNPDGTPATGNIFEAVSSLGEALLNNDPAGIQTAVTSLSAASVHLNQATMLYGNTEVWIQNAQSSASSTLTNLQTSVGALRDTDMADAATRLTTEQTAMQAALQAHASLSVKSLFDYMG